MELLYLVDRTLTRTLQAFSRFIELRLRLRLEMQEFILLLLAVVIGSIISALLDLRVERGIFRFPGWFALGFIGGWFTSAPLTEPLLRKLHCFFDKENALRTDKEYEDGYTAWGFILNACILFLYPYFLPHGFFADSVFVVGCILLMSKSYTAFVQRRKTNTKRKKYLTEAFKALLEKCRQWLPRQPLPEA
jgi:hypothetical protein